jgi:hypothetical protein
MGTDELCRAPCLTLLPICNYDDANNIINLMICGPLVWENCNMFLLYRYFEHVQIFVDLIEHAIVFFIVFDAVVNEMTDVMNDIDV